MPFTGGWSPSPMRTGGGDAGSVAPRLQRIFESIAARRGAAFDQTDQSIVGAETMAYARAIDQDIYGANERFANEMNPATATVDGLLPRWEKIFGALPLPGDSQSARQARVLASAAKFSSLNNMQGIRDACIAVLGPLFVDLTLVTPSTANTWWPGLGGTAGQIISGGGGGLHAVTIGGLTNVPTDAAGKRITIGNSSHPANVGTFPIQSFVNRTGVTFYATGAVAPDNGIGGTSLAPTLTWSLTNQFVPWTSTLVHILVEVDPHAVPGYVNGDGTYNGAFFAAVNALNPVLDWLLPADATFDWYVESSHGAIGWYLDEPNLDVEAFDS